MKGFGSFVPWQQSERLARNPKTGEEVMITPRVSVKFKAGSDLLKELNE
ncbi:HU family DNA-binding protein [Parabacteroides distasonis]|jgi:nucleoid DNA-binding protein|nr:HU family DNA-binding protein [Parabacteroides distasonis]MCD8243437.1 HU family DNA-binding protein [Parabacteroides sp.]MCI7415889.1 HU family DNA-binding protein [Parabacteroides distasonis]MDB9052614.1 HU family DNA-binding protein [Parabacteroides distasonis]